VHVTPGPDSPTAGRTPYLDGLRGIAILLVVVLHYFYLPFHPANHPGSWFVPVHHLLGAAWVGVDLFFVLSGFLLGGILMDHRAAPNLFRIFYLRRTCRILPAYFVFLTPLLFVPLLDSWPALQTLLSTGDIPAWTYPLFLQNLAMTLRGSWGEAWIGTTWSLAVEEQFYLILPLLIRFVPLRRLPVLLLALTLIAPVLRTALHLWAATPQAQVGAYTLLPCRWDSLLLGVLVAWAIRDPQATAWFRQQAGRLRLGWLLLAAAGLALACYFPDMKTVPMRTLGYTLIALLFATTVLCGHLGVLPGRRLLEWSWLRYIGRISYLLYLIHMSVCNLIFHVVVHHSRSMNTPFDLVLLAVSFAVSVSVAAVSWQYFEKPILDLARKSGYRPADPSGGGNPAAGPSGMQPTRA
jgi:peptidoglycan/LPS O-acetylase OafA/YrhL